MHEKFCIPTVLPDISGSVVSGFAVLGDSAFDGTGVGCADGDELGRIGVLILSNLSMFFTDYIRDVSLIFLNIMSISSNVNFSST